MKALTLYIDKWYIIGAVCTDGVPRLITLSNHEDRFWLFFYEDTYNNSIVYGKDNQSHYRNGEAHYIGDVFSLITDPDRRFSRYNGRGEELKTIFQASGIFDTLRSAVDAEGEIETYISFSPDIPGPARLVFFEELKSNGFNVIGSQARIGFLALEHNRRHEKLQDDGYYLVLNACNENLHYILYKREDSKFKMFSENVLVGMGMDLRGRALVESIVDSINNRTHFLSTKEEVEREYLRMEQFVQNWFVKIANAKPYVPITIPNVSFANQPANTYQVSIIRNKLDERTSVIVSNIIKVVADFTKSSGVRNDEIKGLIFIGNTFTNSQFERAIREKFYVAEDNVIRHKESDLPNIVGVYPLLGDLHESDWQKTAEKDLGEIQIRAAFDKERELLEDLINSRSWEEARAHLDKMSNLYLDYSSELSGYKTVIDRGIVEDGNKSARQYDDAVQKVYDFEKNQDYAQMSDWADIALQHRPGDKEATQKKADAVRLLSEQKVREEQYRAIIVRAQKSLKDGQWQDALSQSDAALNLRPTSVEAKRIYNEAKKHIEAAKEIDKYINRADLFFAQKAFDEALRELAKVQSLDPENAEAAQRIKEIEDIRKEHTQKLASLVEQYEKAKSALNYDTAIEICEKLTEIDTLNQRKWSAETEKLKADRDKALEAQKRFEDLKKKAMDADFREDWSSFINFASEAIAIHPNEDLSKRIKRAKKKMESQEKENGYQKEINRVNALLSSGNNDEACDILNRIQKIYPEHQREISELRKRAFAGDDFWGATAPAKKEQPKRPIGFRTPQSKPKPKADFFEEDTPRKKPSPASPKPASKPVEPKAKPSKTTGIDFFDMDFNHKNIK
ncbi:MAG: hypothetical protein K6A96_12615 [Prevotella sp.]|nr:hypothetical protein [Prevotella sp.]